MTLNSGTFDLTVALTCTVRETVWDWFRVWRCPYCDGDQMNLFPDRDIVVLQELFADRLVGRVVAGGDPLFVYGAAPAIVLAPVRKGGSRGSDGSNAEGTGT